MNENHGNRTPNWALLLLIPAAVIITKGAMRRRAMWDPALAGSWGHGEAHERGTFRLPPKIEWMLDTWHTRAHQATESTEPPTATTTA